MPRRSNEDVSHLPSLVSGLHSPSPSSFPSSTDFGYENHDMSVINSNSSFYPKASPTPSMMTSLCSESPLTLGGTASSLPSGYRRLLSDRDNLMMPSIPQATTPFYRKEGTFTPVQEYHHEYNIPVNSMQRDPPLIMTPQSQLITVRQDAAYSQEYFTPQPNSVQMSPLFGLPTFQSPLTLSQNESPMPNQEGSVNLMEPASSTIRKLIRDRKEQIASLPTQCREVPINEYKKNSVPGIDVPLPQNLRGDPHRQARVKTELCNTFMSGKICPFGTRCNYAHGEHELKYTTLFELRDAGLIDNIAGYRTHPCFSWVSTGAW